MYNPFTEENFKESHFTSNMKENIFSSFIKYCE
jgi:hypothetical protein